MRVLSFALSVLALAQWVLCFDEIISWNKQDERYACTGMYSKKDWDGPVDPHISVLFQKTFGDTPQLVSLLIFEWHDADLIGAEDYGKIKKFICDESAVQRDMCSISQLGQYILNGSDIERTSNSSSIKSVYTTTIDTTDSHAITYYVKRTGYYCVNTYAYTATDYHGIVSFRNAFGNLPASQVPKLPFYGAMAICYAVFLALWGFLLYRYRTDILPVQNYITAMAGFLTAEMIIIWGYYDFVNIHGYNSGSKVYVVILGVLNSFRISFSFFLLLLVCLGYSVVKPSLGPVMTKCRILAVLHFIFGVIYSISSYVVNPDEAGPIVLFFIVPHAFTMVVFYLWILSALSETINDLESRKQKVKANMYRNVWRLFLASIIVIFGFFFINSFMMAEVSSDDFVPTVWKTRWFLLDGWLNIIYFVDFVIISIIWRPTENNRRFAMSEEVAQDDDGFDMASLAGSDLELGTMEGPESPRFSVDSAEQVYAAVGRNEDDDSNTDDEIVPPPYSPARDSTPAGPSAGGETMFAVDDEDTDQAESFRDSKKDN
ncbi:hypothetical protein CANCADRAFT_25207 [Tortispora caseinolytica NRRL Y-17796]|uniref:Intimal thickness related receptor IRP domain-containing protein n=1 Tax=Tortispora caseinolytica NRRL Y-17796 TaxID=767744 RepID=A0A1E4TI02_9ASCO|nr:hypothetical protein CANCADRAFT_25207 [Tortispora caseinolytica NRRL Y-17796]